MKTSNKLLIGLAVAMFCTPTFLFLSFRYKLNHGDYTIGSVDNFDNLAVVHLPPFRILEMAGASDVFVMQDTANFFMVEKSSGKKLLLNYERHGDTLKFADFRDYSVHIAPNVAMVIADSVRIEYVLKAAASPGGPEFLLRQADFHLAPAGGNGDYLDSLVIRSEGDGNIDMDPNCSVGLLKLDLMGPVKVDLTDGHVNELRIIGGDSATLNVPGYLLKGAFRPLPSHPARP